MLSKIVMRRAFASNISKGGSENAQVAMARIVNTSNLSIKTSYTPNADKL